MKIEARLGKDVPDAELDDAPEFRRKDASWPLFVGLMLAHGWFLRPRAFPLPREGDRPSVPPQRMKRRVAVFVAAWIAAFVVLPTAWVAGAFALWAVVAGIGVAQVNAWFQNIPEGEPDG